jgi:hypothetical protein
MTNEQLQKMVDDAMKRLTRFINRCAGQQKRQMMAAWKKK